MSRRHSGAMNSTTSLWWVRSGHDEMAGAAGEAGDVAGRPPNVRPPAGKPSIRTPVQSLTDRHRGQVLRAQADVERPGIRSVAEPLGELQDVAGLAQVVASLSESRRDRPREPHAGGSLEDPSVGVVLRSEDVHAVGRTARAAGCGARCSGEQAALFEREKVAVGGLLAHAEAGPDLPRGEDDRRRAPRPSAARNLRTASSSPFGGPCAERRPSGSTAPLRRPPCPRSGSARSA